MSNTSRWASDKERLQEILSRDEFAVQDEPEGNNLLDMLLEWVLDVIARLFAGTEVPDGAASAISYGLILITVVGLLVLVFWLYKKRSGRRKGCGCRW